ncbi:winged helix-turn-helix domain-containing protein [Lacrimispora sp.]|uniref:winged helix-turn-helix domain-containing protein n=1 Tax=Lacrimispora sp. TaxID=2719234 RepID=UPI003460A9B7
MPEYTLHLEDIMIKFTLLKQNKIPKEQNGTLDGTLEEKIFKIIIENPRLTQMEIAVALGISERTTKRLMKYMIESGKLERIGGRRYGYWVVKN